ncbi:MAG: hypothetical protein KatS3mg011_0061 [Acidimicrobiia bacterium]|nr:MAG: hypothetical protein KatS3mg011_0061 [Acidimicrobiia bacterium]
MPEPADLLAADRYAAHLGAELDEVSEEQVVVALRLEERHLDQDGQVAPEVLFGLADCAMSLISNRLRTAMAVAAHLSTTTGCPVGTRLVATARPGMREGPRTVWRIDVTGPDGLVAVFTGTTLELG